MAVRLVDGEWIRIHYLNYAFMSRPPGRKAYPTRRQHRKVVKKQKKLELMYDAHGKPFMGRR